jgi:preprotein translocase subunit SecG
LPFICIRIFIAEQLYASSIGHFIDIYQNYDQMLIVCENIVFVALSIICLSRLFAILLQPTKMRALVESMQGISDNNQLDQHQRKTLLRTRRVLDVISKHFIPYYIVFVMITDFLNIFIGVAGKLEIR